MYRLLFYTCMGNFMGAPICTLFCTLPTKWMKSQAISHREVEFVVRVDGLRVIEVVDVRRALRELALELGEDPLVRDVPQAGRREKGLLVWVRGLS